MIEPRDEDLEIAQDFLGDDERCNDLDLAALIGKIRMDEAVYVKAKVMNDVICRLRTHRDSADLPAGCARSVADWLAKSSPQSGTEEGPTK